MHSPRLRNLRAFTAVCLLSAASMAQAQDSFCPEQIACPGLDLSIGYTADLRHNARGGIDTGNAVSGLFELGALWRTRELFPGTFATASVSLIHVGGDAISGELVGDLQGLNNIEADAGWYLYDLWTDFSFGASQTTSVRTGLLDLNAEFDTSDTAGFFIGPPFGIGTDLAQTGNNGPAVYPVTGLGVRISGSAGSSALWRLAAYDGVPGNPDNRSFVSARLDRDEGLLVIGEMEFSTRRVDKILLGAWSYTAAFGRIDAQATGDTATVRGNRGAYALIDAPVRTSGPVRVNAMLRAGIADSRFNAVGTYVGAAVVAGGLVPARPEDTVGLAVAHGRTGAAFRRSLVAEGADPLRAETAFELTWRAPVQPWLAIVPSMQWVDGPGADRSVRDAWIAGVRFEMTYGRSWQLFSRQVPAAGEAGAVVAGSR